MAWFARQGPVDWFVIALSPGLVMGLIMSFLFFLTNVFFGANGADAPWNYYLFWYIFGMVLTARLSMAGGIDSRFKAPMYSLILTGAVWFYLSGIMPGPGVPGLPQTSSDSDKFWRLILSAPFLGAAWYLSWKITRDVTDIDEKSRLDSGGWVDPPEVLREDPSVKVRQRARKKVDAVQALDEAASETITSATRHSKTRDQSDAKAQVEAKPIRRPGTWVILFSLFCLPFFALAQGLIPAEESGRRMRSLSYAGWFLGSALGLLMTTHFLSLRLYLARRGISMPTGMALGWLILGGVLIVAVVVASLVFPHPDSGQLFQQFFPNQAKHQSGTDLAQGEGAEGKGDKEVGKFQKVDNKDGKKTVEGKQGKGGNKNDGGDGKNAGKNASKEKGNPRDPKQNQGKGQEKQGKGDPNQKEGKPQNDQPNRDNPQDERTQTPSQLQESLSKIMRWVIWLMMLPIAILVMVFFGQMFALNPRWLQDWLDRLKRLLAADLQPKKARASGETGDESESPLGVSARFATLENPFDTGEAAHMSDEQLVECTSRAVLAWAHDLGWKPEGGETFSEFVRRISREPSGANLERIVPYHQMRYYYRLSGKSPDCQNACKAVWKALG